MQQITSARPFTLEVSDAALADLRERLKRTRFPDEAPGAPWRTGASLEYLKELVQYWGSGFDWRAQEARINSFPQFRVALDGIELHFIHARGSGARRFFRPKKLPANDA